jgi:CDP-paratose 2-epimerase
VNILITGGAGFVGSQLATRFKAADSTTRVVAFDNLKRRGAELNLPHFQRLGIEFVHGDIRVYSDLDDIEARFDLVIEAAAEPSVLAGLGGSPRYLAGTNLGGTLNCLELARRHGAGFIFLSTSRVYSIEPLRALGLREGETRLELVDEQVLPGASAAGIGEDFPTDLPRSLYGATKLASELMVQEYAATYDLPAVINRCGVIAGPGQFGKVDQGVFTLWVANHYFGRPLRYMGFGGEGKQVRDLLHPADLYDLLTRQIAGLDSLRGDRFNVGGGRDVSVSLKELTDVCRDVVGAEVPVSSEPLTSPVDIPLYITDALRVRERFGWSPERGVRTIVSEIHEWLGAHEAALRPLFT